MSAPAAVRREQSHLLVPPSARTIRWGSFPVIAGVAALAVWNGARKGGDPATVALPVATALLCVWLCFLFEDAAAETTAGTPTPLLFRRSVRAAISIPAVTAVWFACAWIGPLTGPTAAMTGSFAAQVLVALAAAAVTARVVGGPMGGLLAAGAVAFVALIVPVGVGRPPSVDPAHPPWGAPAVYWSAMAMLAVAVLALAHVDPAHPLARSRGR